MRWPVTFLNSALSERSGIWFGRCHRNSRHMDFPAHAATRRSSSVAGAAAPPIAPTMQASCVRASTGRMQASSMQQAASRSRAVAASAWVPTTPCLGISSGDLRPIVHLAPNSHVAPQLACERTSWAPLPFPSHASVSRMPLVAHARRMGSLGPSSPTPNDPNHNNTHQPAAAHAPAVPDAAAAGAAAAVPGAPDAARCSDAAATAIAPAAPKKRQRRARSSSAAAVAPPAAPPANPAAAPGSDAVSFPGPVPAQLAPPAAAWLQQAGGLPDAAAAPTATAAAAQPQDAAAAAMPAPQAWSVSKRNMSSSSGGSSKRGRSKSVARPGVTLVWLFRCFAVLLSVWCCEARRGGLGWGCCC